MNLEYDSDASTASGKMRTSVNRTLQRRYRLRPSPLVHYDGMESPLRRHRHASRESSVAASDSAVEGTEWLSLLSPHLHNNAPETPTSAAATDGQGKAGPDRKRKRFAALPSPLSANTTPVSPSKRRRVRSAEDEYLSNAVVVSNGYDEDSAGGADLEFSFNAPLTPSSPTVCDAHPGSQPPADTTTEGMSPVAGSGPATVESVGAASIRPSMSFSTFVNKALIFAASALSVSASGINRVHSGVVSRARGIPSWIARFQYLLPHDRMYARHVARLRMIERETFSRHAL